MESSQGNLPSIGQPDEYGVVTFGGMRLGMVEIDRLEQRRNNPRAMNDQEYQTLKRSMERFGFKSFVVVEELEPGRYGVIDGHHRWRAARESQMTRIPVVLLDQDGEKAWSDLAMLTFNVTGSPQEEEYIKLLSELTATLGPEETAAFTALDAAFLATFQEQFEAAVAEAETATSGAEDVREGVYQGRPLYIELPRSPEVEALLALVQQLTGEALVGQAVLRALRQWVQDRSDANEDLEAHKTQLEDDADG